MTQVVTAEAKAVLGGFNQAFIEAVDSKLQSGLALHFHACSSDGFSSRADQNGEAKRGAVRRQLLATGKPVGS